MKQKVEFEIDVPDGKKAVWKDGKVVFEDIKPLLPKTWKEFCEQNEIKEGEYYLDDDCYITEVGIGRRHEIFDRNTLPSKQAVEQHLALMQLHQLRDCYRQGWKPSIPTELDYKLWYITRYGNVLGTDFMPKRAAFLSFQTREIAELFLENFRGLIKQAGDLI